MALGRLGHPRVRVGLLDGRPRQEGDLLQLADLVGYLLTVLHPSSGKERSEFKAAIAEIAGKLDAGLVARVENTITFSQSVVPGT